MIAKILLVLGLILSGAFAGLSYYGKTVEVESIKTQMERVDVDSKKEVKEEVLPSEEATELKKETEEKISEEVKEPVVEEAIELGKKLDVEKEDLEPMSDAELNDLGTEILEEEIETEQ